MHKPRLAAMEKSEGRRKFGLIVVLSLVVAALLGLLMFLS
jgi:hypothetical protein